MQNLKLLAMSTKGWWTELLQIYMPYIYNNGQTIKWEFFERLYPCSDFIIVENLAGMHHLNPLPVYWGKTLDFHHFTFIEQFLTFWKLCSFIIIYKL